MILRCSHCRTRFAADDAHRGKTFRCRVCASPIRTDGEEAAAGGSAPPAEHDSRAVAYAPTMLASSPPPAATGSTAAVVRRNDERSKRDLFGGEIELAAKVVEHKNASPFTAARNENSVLFSLDQLSKPPVRAAESVFPSSAPSAGASANGAAGGKKEDSGLIDLNAMMSSEKLSAQSIRPSPISEAPLGYVREVSLTPVPTVYEAPFAKKKRTGLYAAAAAAVVVALVGVGVVATNNEDARLKAAAAAAAAPPPPPPVTATAEPTPPPAPIAATPPADTKDDKADSKSGARPSKGVKHAVKKSSGASAPAAAPPAPKKPADPCGCHGDLLCNMKCSSH